MVEVKIVSQTEQESMFILNNAIKAFPVPSLLRTPKMYPIGDNFHKTT